VEGTWLDNEGRVSLLCLVTKINEFWGRYASITVVTFNWRRGVLEHATFLIPSSFVDIPIEIGPYATDAFQRNPTYNFQIFGAD
jgi:hypothetical protein